MQSITKREWRVETFDFKTKSNVSRNCKRKRSKSIFTLKDGKPQIPLKEVTNNIEVKKYNDQILTSPVLTKQKLHDVTSPIILRDKKSLIKTKKAKFSEITKLKCARNLIHNINANIEERHTIENQQKYNYKQHVIENNSETDQTKLKNCEESEVCEALNLNKFTSFIQLDEKHTEECIDNICISLSPEYTCTQLSSHIELPGSPSKNSEEDCTENFIFTMQLSPEVKQSNESIRISPLYSQKNYFSQQRAKIELLDSPSKSSQKNEHVKIDECSSQDSSVMTISSNSTVDSVDVRKNETIEFMSNKPKRKFKPGSYAYNLQKLLLKQKSDVAIWKHELYLASTSNCHHVQTELQSIVNLNVIKICNSFDVPLLECTDNAFGEICFLIPDSNYIHDLNLEKRVNIEIYPTYFVKYLNIFDNKVKVFTNVNKIVKLN